MEIECPNCGTWYRVDADQLNPAGARVRCSSCGHRFLAFPDGQAEAGPDLPPGTEPGEGGEPDQGGRRQGSAKPRPPRQPGAAAGKPAGPKGRRDRPGAVGQAGGRRRLPSLFLGLLILLLVGGLVAELGYAFRAQLLGQPWLRSAVKGGLDLTGVDWELPIALDHFWARDVQARLVTLASGRRVTLVEGYLVNRAPFAQRPPRLELRAASPGSQVRYRKIHVPGRRFQLGDTPEADELRRRWQSAQESFPAEMRPGQEEAFVVVLADVPPGVRRFRVEMVE